MVSKVTLLNPMTTSLTTILMATKRDARVELKRRIDQHVPSFDALGQSVSALDASGPDRCA